MPLRLRQAHNDAHWKYETGQPGLIACTVIGLLASICVVSFRLYARRSSPSKTRTDDILIIASLAPLLGYAIVIFCGLSAGLGKHSVVANDLEGVVLISAFLGLMYATTTLLTKASILCSYNRIFPSRLLTRISWVAIVFAAIYNFILAILGFAQCVPFSAAWGASSGKCIGFGAAQVCLGIFNVLMNLTILLLPIRRVLSLRLNLIRKTLFGAAFLVATLACIFSIVRVAAVSELRSGDQSYALAWIAISSFCEMFLGIIAACLAMLQPFFANILFQPLDDMKDDFSSERASKEPIQTSAPIAYQKWKQKPGMNEIVTNKRSSIPPVPKLPPIPIQSPVVLPRPFTPTTSIPTTLRAIRSPAPSTKVATTIRMARPQQRPKLTSRSLRATSRERAHRAKRRLDARIPSYYMSSKARRSNPDLLSVEQIHEYY